MENKSFKKILLGSIFVIGSILISVSFNDVLAQNNMSSMYPNDTETLQDFNNITGSDQSLMANNTDISNPNNNLDNSLSTNENQSN